jgi:hypothetical protein
MVDFHLSILFTTYIIWPLKLKIWIIFWGIFNQCNCHICNTVYKHASFIFFKKAWPEKNNILVHWLCLTKIHYVIHSSENVSSSDCLTVYTPENVSLTIHHNYYLGVLMMLADKLYPKSNISIHKKKHYNFQYEQSAFLVKQNLRNIC